MMVISASCNGALCDDEIGMAGASLFCGSAE